MLFKIRSIIKKGLVTLSRSTQKGQASFLGTVSNYEAIKPYGLNSIPKESENALVLLLSILGTESHKVGIEYNNKNRFSTTSLSPGDVVLFLPEKQSEYNLLKSSGENHQVGTKIAIGNSTTELLQQITDHLQEQADQIDETATHIHATPIGPTQTPSNASNMLTIKANILAIKDLVDSIKGTIG